MPFPQGRPKSDSDKSTDLLPVAERLTELLQKSVTLAPDCVGSTAQKNIAELQNGDVMLLQNVRWHKEEEKNAPAFAKQLAEGCDLYVNDAFGTAHRAHASTVGVCDFLKPKVAGILMKKELDYLNDAVAKPARPFVAIVGGSKVSSKIGVLESLIEKVNTIVLG